MEERGLLQYSMRNPRGLPEKKNAEPKAPRDAYQILKARGFADLYEPSPCKVINAVRHFRAICRLKDEQLLLVQYPRKERWRGLPQFKAAKKIALVHDLKALREWKINGGGCLQMKLPSLPTLTA